MKKASKSASGATKLSKVIWSDRFFQRSRPNNQALKFCFDHRWMPWLIFHSVHLRIVEMQVSGRFSLSAILRCFEQQTAQYSSLILPWVSNPSVFLGKLACIMLTMESTIIDIAMGTDETDLLKASVWLGSDLVVSLRIGMSGCVDEKKLGVCPVDWWNWIGVH